MGAKVPHRSRAGDTPMTKAFLLELAAECEAPSGETVNFDPDDLDVQNAVADRLSALAARRKAWLG
jgi:hypothetical protein